MGAYSPNIIANSFLSCATHNGDGEFISDYNVLTGHFGFDQHSKVVDLATWQSTHGHDRHSIQATAEELFVDPANKDYRLRPGSPALDAGITLDEVADDIDGNPRPRGSAHDIGCYEGTCGER